MNDQATESAKPSMASIQEGIDTRMFVQSPIHIIERYLECFSSSGSMTFQVPVHILEALATRFRLFMDPSSLMESLDQAFGGKVARQRQAQLAGDLGYSIAFDVFMAREEAKKLTPAQRDRRTPLEVAFIHVARERGMSVHNLRRIYKEAKLKDPKKAG